MRGSAKAAGTKPSQFTPTNTRWTRFPPPNIPQLQVEFTVAAALSVKFPAHPVSLLYGYERLSCQRVVFNSRGCFRRFQIKLNQQRTRTSPRPMSQRPLCDGCYLFTSFSSRLFSFTSSEVGTGFYKFHFRFQPNKQHFPSCGLELDLRSYELDTDRVK